MLLAIAGILDFGFLWFLFFWCDAGPVINAWIDPTAHPCRKVGVLCTEYCRSERDKDYMSGIGVVEVENGQTR